jgi:mycothiol synthase
MSTHIDQDTPLSFRPYATEDDYWRLRAFLRRLLPVYEMRQQVWHVARLDYARWHVLQNCLDCPSLVGLNYFWETPEGELAAALTVEGLGEAHFQIDPAYRRPELLAQMLDAAETHLATPIDGGARRLYVFAHSREPEMAELLCGRGYIPVGKPEHSRRQSLGRNLPPPVLPDGYELRSVGEADDLPARSWVSWKAFHPDEPDADYRGWTWYHNIQCQPLYRRDLDLVAVAPDGSHAAFVTLWYDDATRSGYLEPVGTHPDHQRRGLARALITDGLRRLQRLGAQWAYIGSYSPAAHATYEAVGFTEFDLLQAYQREW